MRQCECSVNDTGLGQVLSRATFVPNVCMYNFVRRSLDDDAPRPQMRWTVHLLFVRAMENAQTVVDDSRNREDSRNKGDNKTAVEAV